MKIRIALVLAALATTAAAQTTIAQIGLPDPFGPPERQWAKLADGHAWGTTA